MCFLQILLDAFGAARVRFVAMRAGRGCYPLISESARLPSFIVFCVDLHR